MGNGALMRRDRQRKESEKGRYVEREEVLTDRQNYFMASKLLMRKGAQQTSSHKSCCFAIQPVTDI